MINPMVRLHGILSFAIASLVPMLSPVASALEGLGTKWSRTNIPEAPVEVVFEKNIPYRKGSDRWQLNVIAPKNDGVKPRPAIVVVHGGGWAGNDHFRFSSLGFFLAQKGYVVITPTHRMIIDAPYPACLEDIKNSIRWLRANAGKYNVDPDRIGAYGNSSGGQLALMTALTSGEAKFEGNGSHRKESSAIQAVICSGTVGDMLHEDHSKLAKRVYRNLAGGRNKAIPEEGIVANMELASPVNFVSPDAPPVLMIHGARDTTVHIASTDEFVEKMEEAKADVSYKRYDGSGHGVFVQNQGELLPVMLEFFGKHLKEDT